MSRNRAVLLEFLVAIAVLGAGHLFAPSTHGEDAMTAAAHPPAAWAGVQGEDVASLRRELVEVTRLLRAQQAEMSRQAAQLEQLKCELNGHRAPGLPTGLLPVPPVGPATRAIPVSRATGTADPSHSCVDCVPCGEYDCDECDCYGDDCDPGDPWIDIGGQYRLMFNSSNFDFHPATLSNAQEPQTFFNQRFRTWLTVQPNENVEGHLEVEMGHIGWGENFDFPKTYVGPRWPASVDPNGDRVGMELRKGYLGYQTDGLGRLRAGIQGWQDPFGQTLASSDWDFSVGGLSWAITFPAFSDMSMLLGAFALDEGNIKQADDAMLFTLDLDWARSEGRSFGLSVYYLPDRGVYSYPTAAPYASAWDVWVGMRAGTERWLVPLSGFVIYNSGQRDELGGLPTFSHDGVALKLEAGPVSFGPGKLSFQTLYSTGDDNPNDNRSGEFRTVAQSARDNFGAQGYWSYLVLVAPHGPSDVNDLGVSLQNRGLGLFTVETKYDYPISDRLSGVIALGWLRSDTTNPVSGGHELGTELANMFRLDFGGGLTADFGAAVLFAGDFYKTAPAAGHPENLWEAFTRVQLEF